MPSPDSLVRDHFMTINGLNIHYRDWGDRQLPPLLILHGFDAHSRSWDQVAAALADRYRVIVPDLRGNGESSWAPEYTWELMVEDILSLMSALGLDTPVLCGHSMGGRFAYMLASRYSERVMRLVNVEAYPWDPKVPTGALPSYTDSYDTIEEAALEAYKRQPYADKDSLRHEIEHGLKLREDGRWTWRMDPALRIASWLGKLNPGTELEWPALTQLQCPWVLIYGVHSFGKRGFAEDMARRIPDCELIEIPDAEHDLPNENPKEFIRALHAYLTKDYNSATDHSALRSETK